MTTAEIPHILLPKGALFSKHLSGLLNHPLYFAAQRLLYVSDYAGRQVIHLQRLLEEDDGLTPLTKIDYQQLVADIPLTLKSSSFARYLRYFRHRHLLRLFLRELAGLADTQETITSWSHCADVLILHTLRFCEQELSERYGVPRAENSDRAEMYVIAMGKLGGTELNFSSDIDLIFAFSSAGHTDGESSISNQQYFSKVAQQMMQLLQNTTEDGFVFRVDLRLRPNGDSGPLVSSFAAMETYYQEQGRDWERYAMVKARLIHLVTDTNQWFHRLITPFIYRRYVDFSVIESLRSMKAMIEREIQLNPMLDDIKRGRGGIREIEFIIQSFQLIRGGRLPHIQQQNAISALNALKKEGLLAHTVALQDAYLFFRKLENALQIQNDQQTHTLPVDATKQAQLLLVMGFDSWDRLLSRLQQYQRIVGHAFYAVLRDVNEYQDEKRLLTHQLSSLWQGHIEPTMSIHLLTSLGFKEAESSYQMLYAFRHSPRCRRLPHAARLRLDRFMLVLLNELTHVQEPDAVLLQVLRLLENIVGRSAYLALLTENPHVLQELLLWFAHSPFITSLLVNQPFLLEVLLDQKQTWRPPSRLELEQLLNIKLSHCSEDEMQNEALRQFKLSCWLLAARAELYGECDALRIGRFLADVAEVIIAQVLVRAAEQLKGRHPEIMRVKSRFAIIAYGKLGSREMNYDSDLDLVFLHAAKPEDERLVTRLTQKILHMLTTRSQTGILYSVDTRLRPSGSAGLLVSYLEAFLDYQRVNAWTWEHQALLKARLLFASPRVRAEFMHLKKDILFMPRNRQTLGEEIQQMRAKIDKHVDSHPIKHDPGGLLDLEFLIQFLVLAYPKVECARCTNTLSQLQQLQNQNVLSDLQYSNLKRSYRYYHRVLHQQLLQPTTIETNQYQADVLAICQRIFPRQRKGRLESGEKVGP